MVFLKAFALVFFHFFSAAAFDEMDVLGKHASNPKNISHYEAGGKLNL